MTSNDERNAKVFAQVLGAAKLAGQRSFLRSLGLQFQQGVESRIQYNQTDVDLLNSRHEYTFLIPAGELQVSLQLYKNLSDHHRLFCYTRFGETQGMTFSMNLTTQRQGDHRILLRQRIRFSERYNVYPASAQALRRDKQRVMSQVLREDGLAVNSQFFLTLGVFDPVSERFIETTAERFLHDFIAVSLIKGHFQGNKGYVLPGLPPVPVLDDKWRLEERAETRS